VIFWSASRSYSRGYGKLIASGITHVARLYGDTLLASLHDCLLYFSLGSFVQETSVSLYARAIILPPPFFDDSLCSIGISRSIQSPMSAQKSSKSTQQIPISALKSPITAQKGFVTVQKLSLHASTANARDEECTLFQDLRSPI